LIYPYEEKAFYDILIKVRDDHEFEYLDENAMSLAKISRNLLMIRQNLLTGQAEMTSKINFDSI
jgi:hypothetical protein